MSKTDDFICNDALYHRIRLNLGNFKVSHHENNGLKKAAVALTIVDVFHRIPIAEFMREDAPILQQIPESKHPVLLMPVGVTWIAAPTGALIYQFREVSILGKKTRVAHYEQPYFAWS